MPEIVFYWTISKKKNFGETIFSSKNDFWKDVLYLFGCLEKIAILAELHVFSAILFIFLNFAKFLEKLPKDVLDATFSWSKSFLSEMIH